MAGAGLVYVLTLPPFHALFSFVMMGLASVWLARVLTRTQSYEKSYGASWEDRRHVELEATDTALVYPAVHPLPIGAPATADPEIGFRCAASPLAAG